jgi:PAS domain S-box-containing protein
MRDVRDALQALLNASDEQHFALDLDGRYLAFNDSHAAEMRALYGVEIVVGDRQTDFSLTRADREAALAAHRRVLAGERFVLEVVLGDEGTRRCYEMTHAPLADAAGATVGLMVCVRDVTERRRLEHDLDEERQRFKLLVEHSSEAFLLCHPDGAILTANPAACRLLGRTEEELRAVGRDALVDETDPRYAEGLERRRQTGRHAGEQRMVRADGTSFPADVSTTVFTDPAGNERTSVIIRDLTERAAAEAALRASEEQLARAVEGSGVGPWDWRVQTGEAAFNERWAEIVGYSLDELEPVSIATWTELCHPEDLERPGRCSRSTSHDVHRATSARRACVTKTGAGSGCWTAARSQSGTTKVTRSGCPERISTSPSAYWPRR